MSAGTESRAVVAPSACDTLRKLDGYLAASDYDPSHPWRIEIAVTVAGAVDKPALGETFADEIDNITGATEILDDLLRLALQTCVAAGNCGEAESAIRAARRYIGDVNTYVAHIAAGSQA